VIHVCLYLPLSPHWLPQPASELEKWSKPVGQNEDTVDGSYPITDNTDDSMGDNVCCAIHCMG